MYGRRSRGGNSWVRLLKQIEASKLEALEYGIKPIRFKAYYGQIVDGIYWDRPRRGQSHCWKSHRKTQRLQ